VVFADFAAVQRCHVGTRVNLAHASQHRASGHRNTSARVTRLLRILSNAGPRDLRVSVDAFGSPASDH
ncbi:hypothetical protein, partial [Streptococcus pneumoniae]|uniref:hypothetical protein n=1 Tax=Streptococcus pneumoniae TaxID=1313 RepID=UPI001C99706C